MAQRRTRLGFAIGLLAWVLGGQAAVAHADEPGPGALPIEVLTVMADDGADDQAEALTKALRQAIKEAPGWSAGTGDNSLEVLSIQMKCPMLPALPDASCESRIADQIKVDRFMWAVLKKQGSSVVGELHMWVRGQGENKVDLNYTANLTEASDEALKTIARASVQKLTGGAPKGSVHIKAGTVGGQVFIDGQPVGALVAGEATFPLASGEHSVVVKAPGYADAVAQLVVKPNASTDVAMTLLAVEAKAPLNYRRIGGFAAIGAGVTFGVVGLVSTLQVNGVRNDQRFITYANQYVSSTDVCEAANNKQGPNAAKGERALAGAASFDEAASLCSKASTFQALQFVFYGLAAVSAGTGAYLVATSQPGFTLKPQVGLNSGQLDLAYAW
jgi:hypothetical protein